VQAKKEGIQPRHTRERKDNKINSYIPKQREGIPLRHTRERKDNKINSDIPKQRVEEGSTCLLQQAIYRLDSSFPCSPYRPPESIRFKEHAPILVVLPF